LQWRAGGVRLDAEEASVADLSSKEKSLLEKLLGMSVEQAD
jgi:hypothetical protein